LSGALVAAIALADVAGHPMTQNQNPAPAEHYPNFGTTTRPVLTGREYAVSSMKPQATEAAVRILEAGGNAFDAAVAGQAVLALVDPAMNGIGSDAVILIYDARTKQVVSINAGGPAPRLATIEWYQTHHNGQLVVDDSLLSAVVPGVIDAWFTLLDRWGTMSFAKVLAPAIDIAERGFPLSAGLARSMNVSPKLRRHPTSVKLYQPAGVTWNEGDIFKNPDAGRLLRMLVEAEKGAAAKGRRASLRAARDRFYKGDIAMKMAAFSEAQKALFRYEDFAAYSVRVETPVSINYRGYDVYKNPSASQGPTELLTLNLLEGYDLKAMGLNSAEYIHTSAEAMKLAMSDREKFLGDMNFITIPYDGLLSKPYAAERRKLIERDKAWVEPTLRPGDPNPFRRSPEAPRIDPPWHVTIEGQGDHRSDTSYIAVVDKNRNMVSFEPSNHSIWGSGVVVADLGIIFTCRGDYYTLVAGEANALLPGKWPRSTLQSSLVMKDGQPFLITGSPGADDQVMRTMQTLVNVVDFGMNIQEAIEAPRWSSRAFPASPWPHTMYPGDLSVESRVPAAVQEALRSRGHKLTVEGPWSLGSNGAIMIDWKHGVLKAGADPRVDAYAWAK
jgi:gamma-glutamyltranspeptidase / glutathione hydrolase